jgi:hypothetical protein
VQGANGYKWPATHQAGGSGSTNILLGETFRLKASFDTATCHYLDNAGQAFPSWFQQVLKGLQAYGLYFADYTGSSPGLIGTDADQAWGDPSLATSDNWIFAGWLHCVQLSDLEVVDNQPRVVNTFSGQVQAFTAR